MNDIDKINERLETLNGLCRNFAVRVGREEDSTRATGRRLTQLEKESAITAQHLDRQANAIKKLEALESKPITATEIFGFPAPPPIRGTVTLDEADYKRLKAIERTAKAYKEMMGRVVDVHLPDNHFDLWSNLHLALTGEPRGY